MQYVIVETLTIHVYIGRILGGGYPFSIQLGLIDSTPLKFVFAQVPWQFANMPLRKS